MRLSSTPPNNICKVSVNQPSSLQQRQGMKVPPEVEIALDDIFLALESGLEKTFCKLGQTRGMIPSEHKNKHWFNKGLNPL